MAIRNSTNRIRWPRRGIGVALLPLLTVLVMWLAGGTCAAQSTGNAANSGMRSYLEQRVAARPRDASSWRLLGQHLRQAGELDAAFAALTRAAELDPHSAAIQFALGECLLAVPRPADAARHFQAAARIAPDSEYAAGARQYLAQLPPPADVLQASYDVRRFDGSDVARDIVDEQIASSESPQRWSAKIEFGTLYNSNVALAPTSREFLDDVRASAQAFVNPVLEYRVIDNDWWRVAPTFSGYFSLNADSDLAALNLQSYQPGLYVERTIVGETAIWVPRLAYDFTLDAFDGTTFGRRHAATLSHTGLWDSGDTSVVFWSTDFTNFVDDGADPAISSRDGWTHTLGASHAYLCERRWLRSITIGGQAQYADVQGSDFRYFGASLFVATETPLTETVSAELEGGWGFRNYFDADFDPSRDDNIWRASARLRKQWTDHWSMSAVFNFDQFNSTNELFNAQRFLAGIVGVFEY